MAKYSYTLLPTPNPKEKVPKPLVTVILHYPKSHKITTGIRALVDSGADICLCKKDIGIWLGINFRGKKSMPISGLGNKKYDSYKEAVEISVCGKSYTCPMQFTDCIPPGAAIVLGQKGFFDHFKIAFDLKNLEMEIG